MINIQRRILLVFMWLWGIASVYQALQHSITTIAVVVAYNAYLLYQATDIHLTMNKVPESNELYEALRKGERLHMITYSILIILMALGLKYLH